MGGYGAVKVGLKHHEMFGSINSHSGALGFLRGDPSEVASSSAPSSIGSSARAPAGGPEDPFAIVEKLDHGRIPPIRIDCGTEDFLLDQNRAFHAHLEGDEDPSRVSGVPRLAQLGLLGPPRPARPSPSTSKNLATGSQDPAQEALIHPPPSAFGG